MVELVIQTFFERTGQEEKSDSPTHAVTPLSNWPLWDATLAESFKFEGGCGFFLIWGFGYGFLVCVWIVLRQVTNLIFTCQEMASSLDSPSVDH